MQPFSELFQVFYKAMCHYKTSRPFEIIAKEIMVSPMDALSHCEKPAGNPN